MKNLAFTLALTALVTATASAAAPAGGGASNDAASDEAPGAPPTLNEVIVTATRRNERLQDVPLSITAFSREDLTQKGIVGFEGIAREVPGAVLNVASDNNFRLTARGISTNGWGAGLQTTTTIYLDELPISTVGNTVTQDPNLYDVERVEFLRGPQGTLFGSGSLSGALRILTHSPDLTSFDASALADLGYTPDGSALRQRYDGMVNIPLVTDTLGLRIVSFYRNEDGYIDNVGTGVKNSNSLTDAGGRAILLWKPNDKFSLRLMGSYEDSDPKDASLTSPTLGERKRISSRPDLYTAKTQIYNATLDYKFDFADLISSTTYSVSGQHFDVDLAGTLQDAVPFFLRDELQSRAVVQETRLVSQTGGKFDWVAGSFFLHRDVNINGVYESTPAFLAANAMTGLGPDSIFSSFPSDTRTYELAGFGDVTYHLTSKFSLTGGVRYGRYGGTLDAFPGFNAASYFINGLFAIPGPLVLTPIPASTTKYPTAEKASWKASVSYEPSHNLTEYVTVSTGYRTPVYNSRAGSRSTINPNDLIIPTGAGSDGLTNYEIGLKGHWLDSKLTANLAAYYIDWRNIQVQANRQSDSVQFATNVGRASSKGVEAEITVTPVNDLVLGLNGSWNEAKVTELSTEEAIISGAVKGSRLASPHLQGSLFGTYNYRFTSSTKGFSSFQVEHVGFFPNGFPNTPGTTKQSPLYGFTDAYTYVNLQTGVGVGKTTATLYVENLANSNAVVYIHPEAFIDSRYAILRPRTIGVRFGYQY